MNKIPPDLLIFCKGITQKDAVRRQPDLMAAGPDMVSALLWLMSEEVIHA